MSRVSVADNGKMAAVFAPLPEIERTLKGIGGYVVVANYNSNGQAVIGGETAAVETALEAFHRAGVTASLIPVSHAFHTKIVAPATAPFTSVLERLRIEAPKIPVIANVTGGFYPMDGGRPPKVIDLLSQQVASPVQFVQGLETLYHAGARVFVEVGPKRALQGFVEDVLGPASRRLLPRHEPPAPRRRRRLQPGRLRLLRRRPRGRDGLRAPGGRTSSPRRRGSPPRRSRLPPPTVAVAPAASGRAPPASVVSTALSSGGSGDSIRDLGLLFAEFLEKGMKIHRGEAIPAPAALRPPRRSRSS